MLDTIDFIGFFLLPPASYYKSNQTNISIGFLYLNPPYNTLNLFMKAFDYSLDFKNINFREHPELYRVGKGEQGVLLVEPYKSEILPHWRFKTPEIARESSEKIYNMFLDYLEKDDFVGADMARKFIQMGYTRSRRYANHKSGRKYKKNPQLESSKEAEKEARKDILPFEVDPVKAESAAIFKAKWMEAKQNEKYQQLMVKHQKLYE